ncbi:Uncharacterised protein [Mycobacteroides abscessus subsp. abscessus]|nr:Uncharacterised protein [Mycobacteroides abscessus subsp. abscessus]
MLRQAGRRRGSTVSCVPKPTAAAGPRRWRSRCPIRTPRRHRHPPHPIHPRNNTPKWGRELRAGNPRHPVRSEHRQRCPRASRRCHTDLDTRLNPGQERSRLHQLLTVAFDRRHIRIGLHEARPDTAKNFRERRHLRPVTNITKHFKPPSSSHAISHDVRSSPDLRASLSGQASCSPARREHLSDFIPIFPCRPTIYIHQ